jgi:MoaA/NifB/PqqE/SkfB family radical SAM enzyme
MSGGEALLNQNFFKLCEILKKAGIKVSLLTTGLSIKQHAEQLLKWVNDIIVSIDGDQQLHDAIRNVPGAFHKLREGVQYIKLLNPNYRITARTVIHRLNFWNWSSIIHQAKLMGIDQISFLPADVSSHAFNRQMAWEEPRQNEILLSENELPELQEIIRRVITTCRDDFNSGFIAESPEKIQQIYEYYAAFYGLNPFPFKKCNAPWVSTVIEADGAVRPCFFHEVIGNIKDSSLADILNSDEAIKWRKTLNMSANYICIKCVCSLNLSPLAKLA